MSTLTPTVRPLHVFDISVLGAGSHVWVSVHSNQGSVFGVPRPMPTWPVPRDGATPIDWLTDAVRHARNDAQAEALDVGAALRKLVFGVPEVVTLLQQARGAAGSVGAQLLVRILAAPDEVSSWPWELLTDPQAPDRFLTMARDVHVVRSGRARTYPVRQTPIPPPLNLLMVMSSPIPSAETRDETPFDLYEEKRSLLNELQPLVDRGLLHVEVEDRPTVERLRSRMGAQRRGFHLFHYLGHAQPHGLRLEDPNGRGQLVRSPMFAMLLQQMPDLRLAVFAGCETARAPADGAPTMDWPGAMSIADYCVRDACPMVIGMQAVLPFGTERLFTRFFYQALTGGQPVAEALRLARLAIYDDQYAGGQLLNWAVPSLFVGGSIPEAVADPDAKAQPVPRPRRVSSRVGVRQGELRFISRLTALRQAVDVLSARSTVRLLHVVGLPGTGKTAFLDRALEELDPEIAQLFVVAERLLDKPDPLRELCVLVYDVMVKTGRRPTRGERLDAATWWERLLDELIDVRLALVLDDCDELRADEHGAAVLEALSALTLRRGRVRLAVGAGEEVVELTAPLRASELRRVQLEPLLWHEVWQWIRRNLPALTRYPASELARFYHDLPQLEQWEQLAAAVAGTNAFATEDLPDLVRQVAVQMTSTASTAPQPPPVFGAGAEPEATSVRHALRVAVAGPCTADREAEFGRSVTGFAAEHMVAGRVVTGGSGSSASSLAQLLSLPSPFDQDGQASVDGIRRWLIRAGQENADIVVLDLGSDRPMDAVTREVRALADEGRLVLAAGGNSGKPTYPAFDPDVLAVGALGDDGRPTPCSPYFPEEGKPELYAPARLAGSALSALVADDQVQGTTMSVLYAATGAILVWASDRGMSASDVRSVLVDTAASVPIDDAPVRRLDLGAALARVRRDLIVDALQWEPLELSQLLTETGLQPEAAIPLLDQLVAQRRLVRSSLDGSERYENPDALYLAYARLRQRPSGWQRTGQLQRLVDQAASLAERGRFSQGKVDSLWSSGHDGQRVVALGIVQARPELGRLTMVLDGVVRSRSAFEQYQALQAAVRLQGHLGTAGRREMHDEIEAALARGTVPADGSRYDLARRIVDAPVEADTARASVDVPG